MSLKNFVTVMWTNTQTDRQTDRHGLKYLPGGANKESVVKN